MRHIDGLGGTFLEPAHFADIANTIIDSERSNIASARNQLEQAMATLKGDPTSKEKRLPNPDDFKVQPLAYSVSQYMPWQAHVARRYPAELAALQASAQHFERHTDRRRDGHYKQACDAAMFMHNHGLAYEKALARMEGKATPAPRNDVSRNSDNRNAMRGESSTVSTVPTSPSASRPDNQNRA